MRVERRRTEILVHLTFSDAAYIRDGDGSALESLAEKIREEFPDEIDVTDDRGSHDQGSDYEDDGDFDHQSGRGL